MREIYNKDNPKMLNSAVCFIDILGFSEMVKKSCNNHLGDSLLSRLCHCIKEYKSFIKDPNFNDGTIKIFTDNIVFGIPIYDDGESELGQIFLGIAFYQLSLILEGFFIRGGISVGDYYANDDIAYGPALLEAHTIENKTSHNPRIVLGQSARQMASNHLMYYSDPKRAPQVRALLLDEDGNWFVNYLQAALIIRNGSDYEVMIKHRDIVIDRLMEFSKESYILNKYEWVARYHNYFCKIYFSDNLELQIPYVSNIEKIGFIV